MIIPASQAPATLATTNYDIVIFGATWMGINAALTASYMNKRVAIIETTPYIGGHCVNAGVNLLDVIYTNQIGGQTWQQIQQMAQAMGVAVTGAPSLVSRSSANSALPNYFAPNYVNPSARVVESVLTQNMLKSGADVYLNCPLTTTAGSLVGALSIQNGVIISITTRYGVVKGTQFIDASYEGDLMALAGCSYTIGRESSSTLSPTITPGYNSAASLGYGESLAGVQASPPTFTYTGANFTGPKFPLVANPGLSAGSGDGSIQAYSCRSKVVLNSSGFGAPFVAPAGYLPGDFAVVDGIANSISATTLGNMVSLTAMLNNQIDVNAANPISNDLANGSNSYPDATPSARAIINQNTIKWSQGLLYFLANDTTNTTLKTNVNLYGYDNREWTDNGNFPRIQYVREARRMIGQYVMTQADFSTTGTKTDSIAKTSYDIDCHGPLVYLSGTNVVVRDGDLFVASPLGPVQFPLRSILPNPAQVTNLVVLGTPSVTHVAWCPTRLEPFLAQIGEAAGFVSSLAINLGVPVQSVPYANLLTQLNNSGCLLS